MVVCRLDEGGREGPDTPLLFSLLSGAMPWDEVASHSLLPLSCLWESVDVEHFRGHRKFSKAACSA